MTFFSKLRLAGLAITLASATIAGSACAAVDLAFAFQGVVDSGPNPDVLGLFGTPGADLSGDPVALVFKFDSTLGTRTTTPGASDILLGGTAAPGMPPSPLVSATVTINGVSQAIDGSFLGSIVNEVGVGDAYEGIDGALDFVDVLIFSPSTPEGISAPMIGRYQGGGTASFNGVNPITGGLDEMSFSFTIGVPEPATWAMMILGLFGVGAMLRAARRGGERSVAPAGLVR